MSSQASAVPEEAKVWTLIEGVITRICWMLHKRAMARALALHHRGEVRCDGLLPLTMSSYLEIEWHARRIHPWDFDRPLSVQQELFVQQSLADAEAALTRLFGALPYVGAIRLRIFDPESDLEIIAGTVSRTDISAPDNSLSIGMRLMSLGLRFHSTGYTLEPLEADYPRAREIDRQTSPELVCTYRKSTEE